MRTLPVSFLVAAICVTPAASKSKAVTYLVAQEIGRACEGRPGRIDPAGVIERDLDDDGAPDLIVAHDRIDCSGGRSRSAFCGAQVCSVMFYVRRGSILREADEMLGGDVAVGPGRIPRIAMNTHGGPRASVRWNGHGFR